MKKRKVLVFSVVLALIVVIIFFVSGRVELKFNTGSAIKDIDKSESTYSEKQTSDEPRPEKGNELETHEVISIVDGDTIVINTGDKVRLIGINTPEDGEKCSEDAFKGLENMILHKQITLEQDMSDRDQYGRLLRYIYVKDLFINMEMVRQGLAIAYPYGEDIKYEAEFKDAEAEAKENGGCIWETSSICSIEVSNIHADAAGNDNENLNDEYVAFKNTGDSECDMTSWIVADNSASHRYTFPSFKLASGAEVTLYTGAGTNTATALYWRRTSGAVWNNGVDTVYLRETNGGLVVSKSYRSEN